MTTPTLPEGNWKMSYQSPPRSPSAGRYRTAISSPSINGGAPGSRLRCSASAATCASSSVRADRRRPMSVAARSRSATASGVSGWGTRQPVCRTPSIPSVPTTGTPKSCRSPKSRRMGLSTVCSLISVNRSGSPVAATRPAKPDPTGTWVAPRHRRPRPAEAAGSRTLPVLSNSSRVEVSDPRSVLTSSTSVWTDLGSTTTGAASSSTERDWDRPLGFMGGS